MPEKGSTTYSYSIFRRNYKSIRGSLPRMVKTTVESQGCLFNFCYMFNKGCIIFLKSQKKPHSALCPRVCLNKQKTGRNHLTFLYLSESWNFFRNLKSSKTEDKRGFFCVWWTSARPIWRTMQWILSQYDIIFWYSAYVYFSREGSIAFPIFSKGIHNNKKNFQRVTWLKKSEEPLN